MSRRAWAEPQVRFWWAAALIIGLAGLYLAATEVLNWREGTWLIRHGTPIDATVAVANGQLVSHRGQPGDSPVVLDFTWRDNAYRVEGFLDGRATEQRVAVKDLIRIFIDPKNPTRWTARQVPVSLGGQLAASVAVVVAALFALAVSAIVRRPVLHTWRNGRAAEAVFLGRSRPALAPRSWALRCALAEGQDKRRLHRLRPGPRAGRAGERLRVLVPPPPRAGGRRLAMAWFD